MSQMPRADWSPMNYRNTETKLDQLVGYFNAEKINLNPVFQRGHVWKIGQRRKLIANMVQGKPIPAIFLYKEAAGSRYSYNILDGKQRLESLILFIGSKRSDLRVETWEKYFFPAAQRKHADFWIQLPQGKKQFASLDENVVRDFREYAIPTIEITLNDASHLDEIISLFVDINQQGVAVSRFDVAKAMGKNNGLLRSVFRLLAIQQRRGQAAFYKAKKNDFTRVIRTLPMITSIGDSRSQVDRMWERLLEIVLFIRKRQHKKPVDILKSFISASRPSRRPVALFRDKELAPISATELKTLTDLFRFLAQAYSASLKDTTLATDQTHFYTMVTSLIDGDLLKTYDKDELTKRLIAFGGLLDARAVKPKDSGLAKRIKKYRTLSADRTTDSDRRTERQRQFIEILGEL